MGSWTTPRGQTTRELWTLFVMEDFMRTLRTTFLASAFIAAVTVVASISATAGEKRCRIQPVCQQPAPTQCVASSGQSTAAPQTCCQPQAASIQPQIELIKYERPATPRRLSPQPDALKIGQASTNIRCAIYLAFDYGAYELYYGVQCPTNQPVAIFGSDLGPLPGNCANPNGACVSGGASVIPTASARDGGADQGSSAFQKGVHLSRKLKAGHEPSNPVNPLATGPHQLKERTRVGQPTFVRFQSPNRSGDFVVAELQRYFVKGTGKANEELSATFAVGVEIDAAPEGKSVKSLTPAAIQIIDDYVARVTVGEASYDVVTATKLVP